MKTHSIVTVLLALLMPVSHAQNEQAKLAEKERVEAIGEWRELKFGLFIHFGLYSIPGGVWNGQEIRRGYSEQIQSHAKIPRKDYIALTEQFNPTQWDPDGIALLAKKAGMRYVVITAKHHDGFNLFDTEYSGYDVIDATPYKRDIIKELAEACARHGIKFGVYFSINDWNFPFSPPISDHNSDPVPPELEELVVGQVTELMTKYGPICEVWFDMGKPTVEQSRRFADAVHRHQPKALVSGRVWNNAGDFVVMGDNQIPKEAYAVPWEVPASMYHATWGYRSWQVRNDLEGKIREKIQSLIRVAARGGNYLLNIGPRGDGSVVEFEAQVLEGVGVWLERNGDAIFSAKPIANVDHPSWGELMGAENRLYLLVTDPPENGVLEIPRLKNSVKSVALFGTDAAAPSIEWSVTNQLLQVTLTQEAANPNATVYVVETDGFPSFLPARVAHADEDGSITIGRSDMTAYFGVSGSDYYGQRVSTVALEGYAQISEELEQAELAVVADNLADPQTIYRVQAGDIETLGTLPMRVEFAPGVGVLKIRLERANPAYPAEDLGLAELKIRITPRSK